MKKRMLLIAVPALLALLSLTGFAQLTPTANASREMPPAEIIRRFTEKESELASIWHEYTYRKAITLQVIGPARTVSGEFHQVSEFIFDDRGQRIERIVKAPPSTLDRAGLIMTAEDRNALINIVPFALTKEEAPNYDIIFVGKEKVDDLRTYVFDVTPKVLSNPRELKRLKDQKVEGRYFQGRIWVDDTDFQIVKSAGKVMPEFKQRFPRFETYRENLFENYWLPTYTFGEDVLQFDDFSVPVRQVVRFTNYRRFQSDVKIGDIEEVEPEAETPKPGKAPEKTPVKKPGGTNQ